MLNTAESISLKTFWVLKLSINFIKDIHRYYKYGASHNEKSALTQELLHHSFWKRITLLLVSSPFMFNIRALYLCDLYSAESKRKWGVLIANEQSLHHLHESIHQNSIFHGILQKINSVRIVFMIEDYYTVIITLVWWKSFGWSIDGNSLLYVTQKKRQALVIKETEYSLSS